MPVRRIPWCGLLLAASVTGASARPAQAPAAPAGPVVFQVSRATSAIKVDGVLDEDAWDGAAVIPLPFEWAPGDNVPPPVQTECLVTYDATNLYLAFRASDPDPAGIRAHLMDRDDIDTFIQDDHVGFMIDTFNDERRAFQFRVNPLGVQADAIFSEQDGVEDLSWDMIWASAGRMIGRRLRRRGGAPVQAAPVPGAAQRRRRGASRPSGRTRATCGTGSRSQLHRPEQGLHPVPGEQDRGLRGPRARAEHRTGPDGHRSPDRRRAPPAVRADRRRARRRRRRPDRALGHDVEPDR